MIATDYYLQAAILVKYAFTVPGNSETDDIHDALRCIRYPDEATFRSS